MKYKSILYSLLLILFSHCTADKPNSKEVCLLTVVSINSLNERDKRDLEAGRITESQYQTFVTNRNTMMAGICSFMFLEN
ncbi:hypothetical protein [Leptospira kanakyensis]|uniref:Lipoprotein n=1 Tax=Leptospira kanakyensis TaxID=2484968 RepID=A0A6N4QM23_9LEPT|nr:hypothetical protein [Leptospira kanakyensis]MCW7483328.1 hypothetical protein [Leptospira kanakyensis]TGK53860.1 hypothetical protein EHQ11_05905 [Leptospira kanakyensis]TGK57655.1 hypothetical protein EHQ16_17595 [Leptospira kanakyensis]TGK73365.1 hypothetical protein EHQ18_05980 [Leptospira kanakyensis]